MTPEQQARASIDAQLETAGWHICDADKATLMAWWFGCYRSKGRSALTHFNTKPIAAMSVPLPSLEEQQVIIQEIESRLSVAEKMTVPCMTY